MYNTNIYSNIINWYDANKRDLPWRESNDPYKIWLSEVMLQQTQVNTVIPYYKIWIERYPNLKSVAATELDNLLKLWEGLGYYSRCRNFHTATQTVMRDYDGVIPIDKLSFQSLSGVGEYIAGAVMSIAFDQPFCAIDGNHRRVLYRYLGLKKKTKRNDTRINSLLTGLVNINRPGDINQAIMDIGSSICKPKVANCHQCPLQFSCKAMLTENPLGYPESMGKKIIPSKEMAAVLIEENDNIYISKRSGNGLLGGLWELPHVQLEMDGNDEIEIEKKVHEIYGHQIKVTKNLGRVSHAFTHLKMNITLFECEIGKKAQQNPMGRWVSYSELDNYAFSKGNHKLFGLIKKENV